MAQFDVYENNDLETKKFYPYLLDVQADLLDHLPTRVIIPLLNSRAIKKPMPVLNPIVEISGNKVYMATSQLVGVSTTMLVTRVCSLKEKRDEIIAALDLLFVGF